MSRKEKILVALAWVCVLAGCVVRNEGAARPSSTAVVAPATEEPTLGQPPKQIDFSSQKQMLHLLVYDGNRLKKRKTYSEGLGIVDGDTARELYSKTGNEDSLDVTPILDHCHTQSGDGPCDVKPGFLTIVWRRSLWRYANDNIHPHHGWNLISLKGVGRIEQEILVECYCQFATFGKSEYIPPPSTINVSFDQAELDLLPNVKYKVTVRLVPLDDVKYRAYYNKEYYNSFPLEESREFIVQD